jgi:integrase
MFLYKNKNGKWYVIYTDENGKRTTKSTGQTLKGEANKFLFEFRNKLDEERNQIVKPIQIKQFGFQYLRQRESHFTEKTIKVNKTTFKFLENYFGNVQISEITRNDLEEYFNKRIKDSSIYTARKDLINLSAAFNYAVNSGYLVSNPCKGIKRYRLPERQPLFYSKEDFNKLLYAIDNEDLRDLVLFAVNTGLRQMELITLEWSQINFKDNFLILDNNGHITKSKRIRTIPLNQTCIDILKKRYERSDFQYQNVFTIDNKPILQERFSKQFKSYVINTKINSKLNFHSLRHTHASWLVQSGVSIYVVSKLLGHADIKTTQIYAHLRSDDLRSAVNQLSSII